MNMLSLANQMYLYVACELARAGLMWASVATHTPKKHVLSILSQRSAVKVRLPARSRREQAHAPRSHQFDA